LPFATVSQTFIAFQTYNAPLDTSFTTAHHTYFTICETASPAVHGFAYSIIQSVYIFMSSIKRRKVLQLIWATNISNVF